MALPMIPKRMTQETVAATSHRFRVMLAKPKVLTSSYETR
jgi:hypothetical protein